MDNKVDKHSRASKKLFVFAIVILAVVSIVVGAALSAHKSENNANTSEVVSSKISQILDTKSIVANEEVDCASFAEEVNKISEAMNKIEPEVKGEDAKAKFDEAKQSFIKIKESAEIAKLTSEISDGINEDIISKLKSNDKLKAVGESLETYQAKLKDFKEKYSGTGDDMQAVFDYSELEKASEAVKTEVAKLEEKGLSEVTIEEIVAFYDKIEELRDIISK